MPWYVYSLARGSVFFWGCFALVISLGLPMAGRRKVQRLSRALMILLATTAIVLITISGTPLPLWFYAIWAITLIARLFAARVKSALRTRVLRASIFIVTAIAIGWEAMHAIRPSPLIGQYPRLYVIGDSISAGIGPEHGTPWPALIAADHHLEVIDYSRAGATIESARGRIANEKLADGIVILEIGGNDMLGHATPTQQFYDQLELLVRQIEGPHRKLVMLELPLLPLDNGYGLAQRRVAREHGIMLIPKRFLVDVLQSPGATSDGIHLTAIGQKRLAEMIWSFVSQ